MLFLGLAGVMGVCTGCFDRLMGAGWRGRTVEKVPCRAGVRLMSWGREGRGEVRYRG